MGKPRLVGRWKHARVGDKARGLAALPVKAEISSYSHLGASHARLQVTNGRAPLGEGLGAELRALTLCRKEAVEVGEHTSHLRKVPSEGLFELDVLNNDGAEF